MLYPLSMYEALFQAVAWSLIHSIWQVSLVVLLLACIRNLHIIKKPKNLYIAGIMGLSLIVLAFLVSIYYYYSRNAGLLFESGQAQHLFSSVISSKAVEHKGTSLIFLFLEWINEHTIQLVLLWIGGFLLFSLKTAGGILYISKIKKVSKPLTDPVILGRFSAILKKTRIKFPVEIRISSNVLSPFTFGIYRSTIILPLAMINKLSPDQAEMILAHEIAHILRKDYLVNLLITLVKSILYFHPGIWWIDRFIESEREKASDELAVKLCRNKAFEYARTLLEVQQIQLENTGKSFALAMPFLKQKDQLLYRIERLLGKGPRHGSQTQSFMIIFLLLVMFILTGFSDWGLPGRKSHPAFAMEETVQKDIKNQSDHSTAFIPLKKEEKKGGTIRIQNPVEEKVEENHRIQEVVERKKEFDTQEIEAIEIEMEFEAQGEEIVKEEFNSEEVFELTVQAEWIEKMDSDIFQFKMVDSIIRVESGDLDPRIFHVFPENIIPQINKFKDKSEDHRHAITGLREKSEFLVRGIPPMPEDMIHRYKNQMKKLNQDWKAIYGKEGHVFYLDSIVRDLKYEKIIFEEFYHPVDQAILIEKEAERLLEENNLILISEHENDTHVYTHKIEISSPRQVYFYPE